MNMKEKYVAPDLRFESFRLSKSIALGCTQFGKDIATLLNSMGGYFLDTRAALSCTVDLDPQTMGTVLDDIGYENFCYTNGANQIYLS